MPEKSLSRSYRSDKGQAAVELALLVPLILLFTLLVVQIGVVVEHQILVVHAAREAAREGAVNSSVAEIQNVARKRVELSPSRLKLQVTRDKFAGGIVRVVVKYADPTDLPLIGRLVPDIGLEATVSMRIEQ